MPKAKELQLSLKPSQVVISTEDIVVKYSLLSDGVSANSSLPILYLAWFGFTLQKDA